MFSLPQCSGALLQFFRESTAYVEGVGSVCSCATFVHAEKHGNIKYGAKLSGDKQTRMKQGKLEKSILTFKVNNPEWTPPDGENVLTNLASFMDANSNKLDGLMQFSDPSALAMSMSILHAESPTLAPRYDASSYALDPESLGILLQVQKKFYEVNKEKRYTQNN